MSKLLAMVMKPKPIMYATIKGSLTENNGVFSGFSSSNYLELQQPFTLNADTVAEIVFKINFDNETTQVYLGHPNTYGIQMTKGTADSKIHLYLGNNSSWTLIDNATGTTVLSSLTDYYIKVVFNKGNVQVLLSTDKTNWTTEINRNITLTEEYSYIIDLGRGRTNTQYLKGSIDLNQSYIKINNTKYQLQAVVGYTVVGSPTITDGVVSGFSASDYLKLNKSLNLSTEKVEIVLDIKLTSFSNDGLCILSANNGLNIQLYRQSTQYKLLNLGGNANSGTKQFVLNTNYKVKFVITSTTLDMYVWENNNWILDVSYTVNYTTISNIVIGDNYTHSGTRVFTGSIDLNETYIKVNNKLWFNGQPA